MLVVNRVDFSVKPYKDRLTKLKEILYIPQDTGEGKFCIKLPNELTSDDFKSRDINFRNKLIVHRMDSVYEFGADPAKFFFSN